MILHYCTFILIAENIDVLKTENYNKMENLIRANSQSNFVLPFNVNNALRTYSYLGVLILVGLAAQIQTRIS